MIVRWVFFERRNFDSQQWKETVVLSFIFFQGSQNTATAHSLSSFQQEAGKDKYRYSIDRLLRHYKLFLWSPQQVLLPLLPECCCVISQEKWMVSVTTQPPQPYKGATAAAMSGAAFFSVYSSSLNCTAEYKQLNGILNAPFFLFQTKD